MKKIIALILTLVVLTALLTVPAMAEETISIDFEGVGVTLEVPQAFQETKGVLDAGDGNELGYNTGWYYMEMDYVAMSMDEYIDLMNKDEWTEEDQDNYRASMGNLFMMFSVAPTTSLEKMADYLATMGMTLNMDDVTEIGEADGYTFYLFQDLDDDISAFRPEFAEEFTSLRAMVPEIAAGATLYVPAKPYADVIGKTLSFTTTDVEGNPVASEELFGQHEITMLNLWTSQCHFCIEELPDLEEINGRLAEKDCAIVGLLLDGDDPEALELGKEILAENGVTYTVLVPPENVDDLFDVNAFPTSFFVNRDGVVVGEPVEGKMVDVYEPAIDSLLVGKAEAKTDGVTAGLSADKGIGDKGVAPNDAGMYRIIVLDENGDPVEKATVQFCSDVQCMMGKTDADGLATFEVPEGNYTVHILKVPEGYEKNPDEFTLPATYSDLSIVLKLS